MIISHEHRFIFIKTAKTAGTSVEISLSRLCGERDVITPISPKDEATRREAGGRGPQNFHLPVATLNKKDIAVALNRRERPAFVNHSPASFIREHIDPEVWRDYYKFCFERNPWDKVVSFYFWRNKREPRPSISEFVHSGEASRIRGFDLYTIDSNIVVDRVCRFENLEQELEEVASTLGLPEIPAPPKAKGAHRSDRRHYRDVLSDADRDKIAKVYAREIAHFGYEW